MHPPDLLLDHFVGFLGGVCMVCWLLRSGDKTGVCTTTEPVSPRDNTAHFRLLTSRRHSLGASRESLEPNQEEDPWKEDPRSNAPGTKTTMRTLLTWTGDCVGAFQLKSIRGSRSFSDGGRDNQ